MKMELQVPDEGMSRNVAVNAGQASHVFKGLGDYTIGENTGLLGKSLPSWDMFDTQVRFLCALLVSSLSGGLGLEQGFSLVWQIPPFTGHL